MKRYLIAITAAIALVLAGSTAWATNPFVDVAGNVHSANIDAVYAAGITSGCDGTHYCPSSPVRRDQMGSFLARAFGLTTSGNDHLPVANAKGPRQTYCALADANPGAFKPGPCQPMTKVLDTAGQVGTYTSVAIGSDGLPIVSYYDLDLSALDVVHCGNRACSANNKLTVLESTGDVGKFSSLTIGSDGLPIISFYDATNSALKVLHCANVDCSGTGNVSSTIDTGVGGGNDDTGEWTSIIAGSDGLPFVASYNVSQHVVRGAHCEDVTCGGAVTLHTIANHSASSIRVIPRREGFPLVAFVDTSDNHIYASDCISYDCQTPPHPPSFVDNHVDSFLTGALSADGYPILAYYDSNFGNDLVVQKCDQLDCATVGTRTAVDTGTDDVGTYGSIAIGADGRPVIAYFDNTNKRLRLLHCGDAACTSGNTFFTLDGNTTNVAGQYTSITIGVDGVPVIAYQGVTDQELRFARPSATAS